MMQRYPELDLLRGIAMIFMVIYHVAFDLEAFYGFPIDALSGGWLLVGRTTAILFLMASGISAAVSYHRMQQQHMPAASQWKRHLRRAALIGGGALLVTIVTYVFDPLIYVRFGILHMIAVSALLLPIVMPLKEATLLLALPLLLFPDQILSLLPSHPLMLPLGNPPAGFHSIDYFPLIPWFSVILLGFTGGSALYTHKTSWRNRLPSYHLPPTTYNLAVWPGRHSLLLYLIHQPIILGFLWLVLDTP